MKLFQSKKISDYLNSYFLPNKIKYFSPLTGGVNSRVILVSTITGLKFVIKHYPARDGHNRLNNEVTALKFLKKINFTQRPDLIHSNKDLKLIIISYIEGEKVSKVTPNILSEFINFQKLLNNSKSHPFACKIGLATDACLSLKDLIDQVEHRFKQLDNTIMKDISIKTKIDMLYNIFLNEKNVLPKKLIELNISYDHKIEKKYRTLIVSDFGIHNLIKNKYFYFIDFEYFGWDNPLTLISNFVLHPSMSFSVKKKSVIILKMFELFEDIPDIKSKYKIYNNFFVLRWCCIILGILSPQKKITNTKLDYKNLKNIQFSKLDEMLKNLI